MMLHSIFSKYKGLYPIAGLTMLAISLLCMATACDRPIRNHTLKSFSEQLSSPELTSEKASEIHRSLERISSDSLNDAERHFRSFLLIKSADKAYIEHSNDTAYLEVKDYFTRHHEELLPEVLYYGGRVYSDIGDYPTALQYFNEALEKLEDSEKNLPLRATINSQTGSLLNEIRLYDQANVFIDEAIRIDRLLKDTLNLIYDLQLAGGINMRSGNLNNASKYLNETQSLKYPISSDIQAITEMRLAYVAAKVGNITQAKSRIQAALQSTDSLSRYEALAIAVVVYSKCEIRDSALFYSNEILKSNKKINKHIAINTILSFKELDGEVSDSAFLYIKDYHSLLEKDIKKKDRTAIKNLDLSEISPSGKYGKDPTKYSNESQKGKNLLILFAIIFAVYGIAKLYKRIVRSKRLKRNNADDTANNNNDISYEESSSHSSDNNSEKEDGLSEPNSSEDITDRETESLTNCQNLREHLIELYTEKIKNGIVIPEDLLISTSYKHFKEHVNCGKTVIEKSSLWKELEEDILKVSPNFVSNLHVLTSGSITEIELRTAFLIKCGFKPTDICKICSISPSGVVSRRVSISYKIFTRKLDLKMIDGIIRLL